MFLSAAAVIRAVLGLCNVSLLSSFSQLLLLFSLLFVPQYGRLAAILGLLAFNHCACLRNARRISYVYFALWYIYISGTNKQQPFAIFLLSGSVCDMSLHLHYISSISPCFLYLVNQLGAMMSIWCVCAYVCMKESRKRDEKATQRRVSIEVFPTQPKSSPLTVLLLVI